MNTISTPRIDIDVLIPAFNAARTIESAVTSICRQTFRNVRIIVIDDGSTDETPRILERMAAADHRIMVITTVNRGIVDALNTGLEASQAALIARFDADDIAYPERLEKQFDYLEMHRDCVAVGCNVMMIDREGEQTGTASAFREVVVCDPFHSPCFEPYLLHPFLMARRDALIAVGGYRYVFHSEDADLYWRLLPFGRLSNVEAILGEYRIHDSSVSGKSVINGRISAINSQLAAVSEQRRRKGETDLSFRRKSLQDYQSVETLTGMLMLASHDLTASECAFLATATSAKLMELTSYRPYSLTEGDLKTIKQIIQTHYFTLSVNNRRRFVLRQIIKPKNFRPWSELSLLMPWNIMPIFLWELFVYATRSALGRFGPKH